VLSGGPCSGKTTLIDGLAQRGHAVVAEAAKDVIESPRTGPLRESDPVAFQREILAAQLTRERAALADRDSAYDARTFADRGVVDGLAYLEIAGLEPFPELLAACEAARDRYRTVFLCDLNPEYGANSYRDETAEQAVRLHEALQRAWTHFHPYAVAVPWLPVEERVEFVLRVAGLAANSSTAPPERQRETTD